jgi:hypothetical protein
LRLHRRTGHFHYKANISTRKSWMIKGAYLSVG